jgi:hydroxypyruvate isomerase
MPRFSANISMMFTEHDELDRLQAARDAGFGGVEFQVIFALDADKLAAATAAAGVEWSVVNYPTGPNLQHGPLQAATPGAEAAFDETTAVVRRYAEALRPAAVVVPAYTPPEDVSHEDAVATLVANLRRAAESFAELDIPVIIEALNPEVWPGALLNTTAEVAATVERIGHPNAGVEYDVFHMFPTEGPDIVPIIESVLPRLGNIQFADVPDRHEPGTGTIDFPALFKALDDMGYDKWTAAEYHPSGATLDGLGWLQPYL